MDHATTQVRMAFSLGKRDLPAASSGEFVNSNGTASVAQNSSNGRQREEGVPGGGGGGYIPEQACRLPDPHAQTQDKAESAAAKEMAKRGYRDHAITQVCMHFSFGGKGGGEGLYT